MGTTIAIRFPGGRYHASPWETHVNEAQLEWPPSPWRILRALIATWHRKVTPEECSEVALAQLIHRLSETLPRYRLPRATHSHARHYMPERVGKGEKKRLIFDAFARLDPDAELVVEWASLELGPAERGHFGVLLDRLGYLGRAESWAEARLLETWDGGFDCSPLSEGTEGPPGDVVRLPAPLSPAEYGRWREERVEALGLTKARLNVGQKRLLATLPERLIDALRIETAAFQKEGWSRAPGMRFVEYVRPVGALEPPMGGPRARPGRARPVSTVRLVLARQSKPSSPLPRLVAALKIGERMRMAALRKADELTTAEGDIPPALSGHDMPSSNRHEHAFYLPEDADGDGRLDHILIHADAGLGRTALAALDRVRSLWLDEGAEWRVILEDYGERETFGAHPYLRPSRTWISVTPYLHPWYRKKGFMHADQLRRECRERGLPEPTADQIEAIDSHGGRLRPVHFHRFRNRRGLRQPDTQGSLWRLTFPEPVAGPIALGFACHHGLGIFRAEEG